MRSSHFWVVSVSKPKSLSSSSSYKGWDSLDSQSSHAQDDHHGDLQPPLHLDGPDQDGGQDGQRQVGDDGHDREEEADGAVEPRIAAAHAGAPQGVHRMADVSDGDDEDNGRAELERDQTPECVGEPAAPVGDADQADADTTLDGDSAGGVEELGDVEKLGEKVSH